MASVYDVANYFIDITNSSEDDQITNLKLNKLLYYAQGVYLARTGKPLFPDVIEPWQYGPVVPSIYQKYRVCGKNPIQEVDEGYNYQIFSSDELETLTDVMRDFGKYTGAMLVNMTHAKDTPWSLAYYAGKKEIPKDIIQDYFIKHPVPRFSFNIPIVDEFPTEWYDPDEDDEWREYL